SSVIRTSIADLQPGNHSKNSRRIAASWFLAGLDATAPQLHPMTRIAIGQRASRQSSTAATQSASQDARRAITSGSCPTFYLHAHLIQKLRPWQKILAH